MRANKEILLEKRNSLITFHCPGKVSNDSIIITFGSIWSDLQERGFGTSYFLKNGYRTVYVAQKQGRQYQDLSLDEFYCALAGRFSGDRFVTYGSSLGGYASVYFGGAIDAKILAFSPFNSAHPFISKTESELWRHKEIFHNPISDIRPTVVIDPLQKKDLLFYDRVISPAYPDVELVTFPGGGHNLVKYMNGQGLLKEFIIKRV